jgi:arylsulfatase A-like enzyme
MLGMIEGKDETIHEALYFEMTYHAAYDPIRAIRTDQYKYIRSFIDRLMYFAPNIDAGHAKDYLRDLGSCEAPRPPEQIYNLSEDPFEQNNVVDEPEYKKVAKQLRGQLVEWMESTGDPLLAGQVQAPLGARVSRPKGYEAADTFTVTKDTPIQ